MYILECSDGSYYTGSTNNLELRLLQHQNGEGANHTKKHLPVKLIYFEEFQRIVDAFNREKQVQGWNRKKKEALIKGEFGMLPELSKNYTQYSHTVASTSDHPVASTSDHTVASTSSATGKPLPLPELFPLPEPVEGNTSTNSPYGGKNFEWVERIYKAGNSFIHLTDKHILSSIKTTDQKNTVAFSLGVCFIPEKEKLEQLCIWEKSQKE